MPAPKVAALVVAAGQGDRFGGALPKQYQLLAGRTVIARALDAFAGHGRVQTLACVIAPGAQAEFEAATAGHDIAIVVEGGASRQESVRNGLEALAASAAPPDLVLIHDAARPLTPAKTIDAVIDALAEADGAAPALAVVDTLSFRQGDGFGEETDREALLRRQTPQGFRFQAILDAHRRFAATPVTDDIALARLAGLSTAATQGSERLLKLTRPEDKTMAEAMLAGDARISVGNGYDVHAFGPGDSVMLCGVEIPHSHGLVGHSDADVAMHALTDAMLGAVAAGDIGQHFPPTDPQWKGAASHIFLEAALAEIGRQGGRLDAVDVTIVCQRPKVGPHRDAMRKRLADLLDLPLACVNVKATTTEGLGFTGRSEGVAALATATVRRWL